MHDKKENIVLKYTFDLACSKNIEERKKIPPFFLFERNDIGGIVFRGLLVPGYSNIEEREWLVALWAKKNEGGRFQNYKSIFTVVDTSSGSAFKPNEAAIDLRWLDDLNEGKGYESKYAPLEWKKWIETGKCKALKAYVEPKIRKRNEQIPKDPEKLKMLNIIINYFKEDRTYFEKLALVIATLADNNMLEDPYHTRAVRDGGRDGIGQYTIMNNLNNPLKVTYAVEAKCYSLDDGVGVKETSRLISRIRNRQFGILVTTSFVADQAYKEIIEDEQPIAIIAGIDVIDILYNKLNITNSNILLDYLITNYPKRI